METEDLLAKARKQLQETRRRVALTKQRFLDTAALVALAWRARDASPGISGDSRRVPDHQLVWFRYGERCDVCHEYGVAWALLRYDDTGTFPHQLVEVRCEACWGKPACTTL